MQKARLSRMGLAVAVAALVATLVGVTPAGAAGSRQIPAAGVTTISGGVLGSDAVTSRELRGGGSAEGGTPPFAGIIGDRSKWTEGHRGDQNGQHGGNDGNGESRGSGGTLLASFDGLNLRQQRLANGGNQFTVEPPDQGLCVGNDKILEPVNTVLRVFDKSGNPLTGVVDLNTFYGYAAQFNRTTGDVGPFVTDPSCLYDKATNRWFQVVLTLGIDAPTGDFTGRNTIDIAVSQTGDPLGAWTIYRIPVQDDGTETTPNHGCRPDPADPPDPTATNPNACIGDYPHIGADANGFYVTTNEYDLFGANFHAAQIYAFSKKQLTSGAASVRMTQIDTAGMVNGNPGFTVWPAQSPNRASGDNQEGNQDGSSRRRDRFNGNGTEYFLSSNSASEAHNNGPAAPSTELVVWALTNTASLDSATPSLQLGNAVLPVKKYAQPPLANQKPGSTPLADCVNAPADLPIPAFPGLKGCYKVLALPSPKPFGTEVLSPLDSNDTRMQQVTFANGRLYGALDTALTVGGVNKAGIEYFVVRPRSDLASSRVEQNGYVGLAGNNLIYPAIGVTSEGRGVMAFTVVGNDFHPSAGYALFGEDGLGGIQIAAAGKGPQDGFTGYKAFSTDEDGNPNPPRPRWGDYGAAVVDGNTIWIASEYIAQTCTFEQYISAPFGSCGGTRVTLGNWATRISAVQP